MFEWFGRKAAREAVRPALLRGFVGSEAYGAAGAPRSYEAQVREAYLSNPVAQRAVKLVAEGLGSCVVYDAGEDAALRRPSTAPLRGSVPSIGSTMPRMVEGRPGDDPTRCSVPGRISAASLVTAALLETVATQMLLHGNAFIQILHDDRGEPAELWALRPERVNVEADARGWPVAYIYKVGDARSRIAATDATGRPQVVHLKALHPLDDHYGLGSLGCAGGAVALHNQATRWNKALLDNAARPSGALVYEPGDGAALSGEQFDRLRAEMEASFAGAGNAGRPMLLEGGLKWQAMSLTPADMDFVGLKAAAAREIALAFGVPPMLIGLPGDAAYANYREANKALWRLTILPLAGRVLEGIGAGLAAWWPGCRLAVDVDQVGALAEERERLWDAVGAADFLSREEKRELLGFAASAETSADKGAVAGTGENR